MKIHDWLNQMRLHHSGFEDEQDASLKPSIAALLYHVIQADGRESERKKRVFLRFFVDQFGMEEDQVAQLYREASRMERDYGACLEAVDHALGREPGHRKQLLEYLNRILVQDSVTAQEIALFEQARQALFPEIAKPEQGLFSGPE